MNVSHWKHIPRSKTLKPIQRCGNGGIIMLGDINIIKHLKVLSSDTGKVLRHLERLRQHVNEMRAELARLKALDRLMEEGYGLSYKRYSEFIEALENAIASADKEMTILATSLEKNLQDHKGK